MNKLLIAHRGYTDLAPENTKLSFDLALEHHFDGIEIDVHKTKDNALVITHDESIDRVSNGSGFIQNLTLEELKELNFAHNIKVEKQTILTYEEFLLLYGDKFEVLNIEIKNNVIEYPGIEEDLLRITNKVNPKAKIIYSSFNFQSLIRMNKLDKNVSLAFIVYEKNELIENYSQINNICEYINPWFKLFEDKEAPDLINKLNLPIITWTLDKPENYDYWSNGSHEVINEILNMDNIAGVISNIFYKIK